MSLNVGCLVRKFDWKSKWRSSHPLKWLERQGFSAVSAPLTEAHPDHFQNSNRMVIFAQKDQEIWLGLGIFHVFNKMCQSENFTRLGSGVVMVADDQSGYYGVQEFFDGKPGWGAQVATTSVELWYRQVGTASNKNVQSSTQKSSFEGIAGLLSSDPTLIAACMGNQNANASCGIAWNGEQKRWVLALPHNSGAQFQEIDTKSFIPTGRFFVAVDHAEGWPRYWRQSDLFAAVQEHLSRAWCGVGLSEFSLNHPTLRGECLLVELDFDR